MALTKNLGTLSSGNAYSHSVFYHYLEQKSEIINTEYRVVVLLLSTHKNSFDLDFDSAGEARPLNIMTSNLG